MQPFSFLTFFFLLMVVPVLAKGVGDRHFRAEGAQPVFSRRKPVLSLQCGPHGPSPLLGWVCI